MEITRELVEELGTYSTPTILNGLKRLGVPTSELEVMDRNAVGAMSPLLGPRCGFAVTRKMMTRKSGAPGKMLDVPPDQGLLAIPGPRFLVVENVGEWQGPVCIWGEITSFIHTACDCFAGVTNGPVRDVPEMEALGFASFANGAGAGGGMVDLLEINSPVTVGGMEVSPGDLIHGDRHGITKIPQHLAPDLPAAIARHAEWEQGIFDICRTRPLDLGALAAAMKPKA
ncbi:RraA family protein [Novosphingobium pentaromativorans]|uniref:Demethylmenaquinone methyltransferase n=1 Tax=Novosphingobium pentaromativorans US6-1 TaxID=1088721 RepID=G6ECL4_9SPHN|nr:RraA family protein [Novosphingobium pentaromativorans]EHJ60925.1 hypothetical protein NSU_2085 [Novosphingobium pentaromativorans US6-1]